MLRVLNKTGARQFSSLEFGMEQILEQTRIKLLNSYGEMI